MTSTQDEQLREAQDKRRAALIERISTIADLACEKPLQGELGDIAYDLLRQAAAQISSDRLRLASLPAPDTAETATIRLNITKQEARDLTRVARWERESAEALGWPDTAVEVVVTQADIDMANDYLTSAFRCTATLAERFAKVRLASAPQATATGVDEEWREIRQHAQPRISEGYYAVRISRPGYWFVKGPGPVAALSTGDAEGGV